MNIKNREIESEDEVWWKIPGYPDYEAEKHFNRNNNVLVCCKCKIPSAWGFKWRFKD